MRASPPPWVWLNLACLDAPLVAVSWQMLFARALRVEVAPATTCALFLTAWLIYLADRFGDSLSLAAGMPTSLRQRFCRQHRAVWSAAMVGAGLADFFVIFRLLDSFTVFIGAAVGGCALLYLAINQIKPALWRILPLKEISIGFLFAAGTMLPLAPGLTSAVLPGWILFACLCCLNCVCIAVWERSLDMAQGRISIATAFPRIGRLALPALGAVLSAGFALIWCSAGARSVYLCVVASAFLLAIAHLLKDIDADVHTAMADIVLLTPVVALLVATLA